MSTYTVDITLGSYTFTITSADDPADPAVIYVLDGLRIYWENPDNLPPPSQPEPVEARLTLMVFDKADLADLDIGTTAQIVVTSAGTTVAAFTGRVGDVTATPGRFGEDQVLIYKILLADYTVDLAELQINTVLPLQTAAARFTAISAAIAAVDGPVVDLPAMGTGASFDALTDAAAPALSVLNDHLRQIAVGLNWGAARYIIVPTTTAGVLTGFEAVLRESTATTWGPGAFAMVDDELTIVFDGDAPPDLDGWDMGLVVDGCQTVEDDIAFRLSKFGNPNTVVVTWTGGEETVTMRSADEPPITLRLSSTWTSAHVADDMAFMYLPIGSNSTRWSVEGVVWEPTDAELAALPFPLAPDTDTGNLSCYTAQVAITDVPPAINPANDSPFYGGTLDGVELLIVGGTVTCLLKIDRRIAGPFPRLNTSDDFKGVRPIDIAAEFPTVTPAEVDPAISVYETRLVRRPA